MPIRHKYNITECKNNTSSLIRHFNIIQFILFSNSLSQKYSQSLRYTVDDHHRHTHRLTGLKDTLLKETHQLVPFSQWLAPYQQLIKHPWCILPVLWALQTDLETKKKALVASLPLIMSSEVHLLKPPHVHSKLLVCLHPLAFMRSKDISKTWRTPAPKDKDSF